jgi:hypothetical protein
MFTDRGTFKAKGKTEEVRLYEPAVRTPEAPRGADA